MTATAIYGTLSSPDLTYAHNSLSCYRPMYFAHMVFSYAVFAAGVGAFVTRLIQPLKWLHAWMGRLYIIFMLWATATSLIIHNNGLPLGVLVSFVFVLGGMTIAWVLIKFYERDMERQAAARVLENIKTNGAHGDDLVKMLQQARAEIAASKTFKQRFFSLKALHGIIMFTSWMNIAGRVFVTAPPSEYVCFTYPAFKPIDSKHGLYANSTEVQFLPPTSPNNSGPWDRTGLLVWGLALSLGPLIGSAIFGAVFSLLAARYRASRSGSGADVKQAYTLQMAGTA